MQEVAQRLGATLTQIALVWVLHQNRMLAIPKAGSVAHVRENWATADLHLPASELAALDVAFPRSSHRVRLEML